MRALLALLAALTAADPSASSASSTSSTPSAPTGAARTPTALLVPRAACYAPLHTAFDETRFHSYEPARPIYERFTIRLLSYEDTCGPEWRVTVTRLGLATLSDGGSVVGAGCLGAEVCGALAAASRALRRARPTACGGVEARGAAVAELGARLGWRRALLPPAAPRSECAAALLQVARALAAAGLLVRRAPLSPAELVRRPDVVILCASRGAGAAESSGAALGAEGAGPPALLLHVDECDEPPRVVDDSSRSPPNDHNEAFRSSNINLAVGLSLYARIKRNSSSDKISIRGEIRNLSSYFSLKESIKTVVVDENEGHRKKNVTSKEFDGLQNVHDEYIDEGLLNNFEEAMNKVNFEYETKTRARRKRPRRSPYEVGSKNQSIHIDSSLPRNEIMFFRFLLLLTDEDLTRFPYVDNIHMYDKILEAVENESKAERIRLEHTKVNFHLYELSNSTSGAWRLAAVVTTASSRALDASDEWMTAVELRNVSVSLDSWRARGAAVAEAAGAEAAGALWAVAACGALALATSSALLLRWAATRRRRRRRRRDAVLAAADFTFPVDERRRVGEGMETMLSCWLQQLHEFGGPELERPDLLKQPPCVAPRVPSAPSSTCSVNRVVVDRRIRYKGDVVHVKYLPATAGLELKRKATDVLLVMQNLRHENLNPFIGCLCELRPALVFDNCWRGSLEDVLMADDIKLDWTFRLSLLTDLVKGMRYLHASPLRVHGRLSSRNCVVDSRWVLRLTDYGMPALFRAQGLPHPHRTARDLLWTAPELLREPCGGRRGTQPGDVFSFAIIMQEVIVRGEPYCMLALTPEEIVEKVTRPPPLIRPSVSMGAAPPDAVSVMRQCWSEAPDLRPDFHRLHDIFRHLHRGRKVNIVDSMFEMLEKYSNNLEELIKERTEQLDMEKKKTEQLLNRMLPRSVAERLLLGVRVEPEEFSEVSIYFSDIVGFTALAARSTPVQVVDLLNDLYTTFDAAIEQYRVYKVETIGDAYMVVGGLPVRTTPREHAESVATMALHLLHLAGRFRVRHLPDTPLHLRSGLHSGPCCAAVVGLTMPRYCLFGDTVNTASRMESTGAAWRIQVSAATAERLTAAGGYRLRSRGLTQIKGKGAMHTYWLLGKDGFDKPLPTPPPLQSEEVLFEMDGENESECLLAPSSSPSVPRGTLSGALGGAGGGAGGGAAGGAAGGVERQSSDPTVAADKQAWLRSSAVSADCSPPRPARVSTDCRETRDCREARSSLVLPGADHSAQYSRYRCLGSGRRPLRRQWSLERGDALAAAAAGAELASSAPPSPPEPLALLASAAPPRAPAARYKTRPELAQPAPAPTLPGPPPDDVPRPL